MSNTRFNSTDQSGTNMLGFVVSEELGWIQRPQPFYDVGIDSIIEEVVDGMPKGRFIAVQLKSGRSHFSIGKNKLTIYISNVHKIYWLGLNIPIILVGYIPGFDYLVWEEISECTLKRTPTKWKLEIPQSKKLNKKSIEYLTSILNSSKKGLILPNLRDENNKLDIETILNEISLIQDAAESVSNINNSMMKLTTKMSQCIGDINIATNKDEATSIFNKIGKDLALTAKRTLQELEIFSETFGVSVSAYHQCKTILKHSNRIKSVKEVEEQTFIMSQTISTTIESLKNLRQTVQSVKPETPIFKTGRNKYIDSVDQMIYEYSEARKLLKKD